MHSLNVAGIVILLTVIALFVLTLPPSFIQF